MAVCLRGDSFGCYGSFPAAALTSDCLTRHEPWEGPEETVPLTPASNFWRAFLSDLQIRFQGVQDLIRMHSLLLRAADHQTTSLAVVPGDLVKLVGQLVQLQAGDLLPAQHGRVHRPHRLVHVPRDRGHLPSSVPRSRPLGAARCDRPRPRRAAPAAPCRTGSLVPSVGGVFLGFVDTNHFLLSPLSPLPSRSTSASTAPVPGLARRSLATAREARNRDQRPSLRQSGSFGCLK